MRTQKTDAPSLSLLPSAQAFAKARVFSLFLQPLGFGTELKTWDPLSRATQTKATERRLKQAPVLEPTAGANRKDEPAHGHAAF